MARGRKKKTGLDIRQKLAGPFLVKFLDEKKQEVYFAGVSWNTIVELHKTAKIKFICIETIATEFFRPKDVTNQSLKKLNEKYK